MLVMTLYLFYLITNSIVLLKQDQFLRFSKDFLPVLTGLNSLSMSAWGDFSTLSTTSHT